MKRAIGWLLAHTLYWAGDLVSKLDYFGNLHWLVNVLIMTSFRIDNWASDGEGSVWPTQEHAGLDAYLKTVHFYTPPDDE